MVVAVVVVEADRRARVVSLVGALILAGACTPRVIDDDAGALPDGGSYTPCVDDSQCGDGATCRAGICTSSVCASKTDCLAGLVCVDGACAEPPAQCASSDECPGAEVCDGFSRACFDPNGGGCQLDSDCALEPGCASGCTCEIGTCEPIPGGDDAGVVVGDAIDLGGYVLENRENDPPQQVTVLPAGTTLGAGRVLVIARSAERASFESTWGTMPANAQFLNANIESSGVPIVNGDERFAVRSPVGTTLDGPTIAGNSGHSYRRTSGGSADDDGSWTEGLEGDATPGAHELGNAHVGLVITEWSDSSGSGQFAFEFIELAYLP